MQKANWRINLKVWFILVVLMLIPIIGLLSPGGLGIGGDQEITQTVERGSTGKVIKQTEVQRNISGKTVWDWLSLLGVPLVLTFFGLWLQELQQKRADEQAHIEKIKEAQRIQDEEAREAQRIQVELEIAKNNQREEAIQTYFDRVSALLIDKNLMALTSKLDQEGECLTDREKDQIDATVNVIRAATLSILRRLGDDGQRKGVIVQFLIESQILRRLKLSLRGADLRGASLRGINLQGIDLRQANLVGADLISANFTKAQLENADLRESNLSYAKLNEANLAKTILFEAALYRAEFIQADLHGAQLCRADIGGVDFNQADLRGANLSEADLQGASLTDAQLFMTNLTGAKLYHSELIEEQLSSAFLCRTELPAGFTIDPNRDCNSLKQ